MPRRDLRGQLRSFSPEPGQAPPPSAGKVTLVGLLLVVVSIGLVALVGRKVPLGEIW
jgi:hypothetical protein